MAATPSWTLVGQLVNAAGNPQAGVKLQASRMGAADTVDGSLAVVQTLSTTSGTDGKVSLILPSFTGALWRIQVALDNPTTLPDPGIGAVVDLRTLSPAYVPSYSEEGQASQGAGVVGVQVSGDQMTFKLSNGAQLPTITIPTGPVGSLTMGTVTTGAVGQPGSAFVTGDPGSQKLNLVIPVVDPADAIRQAGYDPAQVAKAAEAYDLAQDSAGSASAAQAAASNSAAAAAASAALVGAPAGSAINAHLGADSTNLAAKVVGPRSWQTNVKAFDQRTGLYNVSAATLPRYRQALGAATAGIMSCHIAILGDSTTHRADDTSPAHRVSWPARLRDLIQARTGLPTSGTGILHTWNTISEASTEPRVVRVTGGASGYVSDLPAGTFGPYMNSVVEVATDYGISNGFVRFTPGQATTALWAYTLGSGTRTRVHATSATLGQSLKFECAAYYGESFSPGAGYTAVALEDGYVRTNSPGTSGGQCVARIVVPKASDWVFEVRSMQPGATYLAALEARDETVAGIRVSNVAQAGMDLNTIVGNDDPASGYKGTSIAVNTLPEAKLWIIALGLNDYQGHRDVANFKNQLRILAQRCRATGPAGTDGHGVGPGGDVLLVVQPLPNPATNPPDGNHTPPLEDYWRATYEIADELNLPLVDQAYRWVDYASTPTGMYRDGIHPNPTGAADLARAVALALEA